MTRLALIQGEGHRLPAGTIRPSTGLANLRQRPKPPQVHPSLYDWAQDDDTTIMLITSPLKASLMHQALIERGTGNSLRPGGQVWLDLAKEVRAAVRGQVVRPDDCNPQGMPRPTNG